MTIPTGTTARSRPSLADPRAVPDRGGRGSLREAPQAAPQLTGDSPVRAPEYTGIRCVYRSGKGEPAMADKTAKPWAAVGHGQLPAWHVASADLVPVAARPARGACPCHPGSRSGWARAPGPAVVLIIRTLALLKSFRGGSQTGSQRPQMQGYVKPRSAAVSAARRHVRPHLASSAMSRECLLSSRPQVRVMPGAALRRRRSGFHAASGGLRQWAGGSPPGRGRAR